MDIANISLGMCNADYMSRIDFAVLGKTLDLMETQGASTIKMMEQSVQPNLGANIDIRI